MSSGGKFRRLHLVMTIGLGLLFLGNAAMFWIIVSDFRFHFLPFPVLWIIMVSYGVVSFGATVCALIACIRSTLELYFQIKVK